MDESKEIRVEVVYAKPDKQVLTELTVPAGITVAEAIAQSGILAVYPGDSIQSLPVAIWGVLAESSQVVCDGDRIEILRPLEIDPREFRRNLALDGKFMGTAAEKPDGD